MSQQRSRFPSMVGAFSMIVVLCSALPGAAVAGDDRDRDNATLVGTWRNSITFPGVPIEFFDLIAFNEDGTLTERFGSRVGGPGLTVSIGVWTKVGRRTFAATFENFSDTDGNGLFDVRFRIRTTIHLVDRDTYTATATIDTLSVDGTTQLGPSFPGATSQGTRMRVIPE